jgi:4-carboxymuconolactone decarboxylase
MMAKPVPDMYLKLKQRHGALMTAAEALGQAARQEGPLDEREIQLIQLAAAAAIRSEGSVHSHTRRALDAGATAEEIRHALLVLVSTIGFPSVVAATSWAEDILEPDAPSASHTPRK